MGKLHLSIFSFDSRIDFQNGYVRQELYCKEHDTLKDILQSVDERYFGYQEFGVDLDFIHCRINGYAIFGNLAMKEIVSKLGCQLEIEPLSKRYAKKDLLLDLDIAFAKYSDFFYEMDFIAPSEKDELKKYLLINFIVPCHDDTYCGDGFLLYIKWLLLRYPIYKDKLLRFIACKDGNIFQHISTASFMLPHNRAIDTQIESLQSMLLAPTCKHKKWLTLGSYIASQYNFRCNEKISDYNAAESFTPFIQSILHGSNMQNIESYK